MAARYHPDRHENNELKDLAQEKLAQLNQAYKILSDPKRRLTYDRERQGIPANETPGQTISETRPGSMTISRLITLAAIGAGAFFALRFVRSPRAMVVIALAIALAWFGPRIMGFFKGKKK